MKEIKSRRSAGVLLHITSLPSAFGIGDMGPEAKKFVDFLNRSKQRYWQILPLNPIGPEQKYSPYSSTSSMAGNTLIISPEQLVSEGLLTTRELKKYIVPPSNEVNFKAALEIRQLFLKKAYTKFLTKGKALIVFRKFCKQEAYWLDDFALYTMLKQLHESNPWYEWPEEYKLRNKNVIHKFSRDFSEPIHYIKWQQFIFFRQWLALKKYANDLQLFIFGDLPFYVSHDSADVWSHPDIFNIHKKGNMTGVAGVPPDYFNRNGQLWGMPTFRWDVLKKRKYDWWLQRISKNMELYDLLRLDHFRAFADYWEVPAKDKTAIHGKWRSGPRLHFFNALQRERGDLPFVAEDLGDINDAVYRLRDEFKLPGMKVLQFAFGDSMPQSDYIPHNYTANFLAYTGTHDNNTTRGWFRQSASKKDQRQIAAYLGKRINEKNIHQELARAAYASVAKTVILPLQDVLGLDERARMNTPASIEGNWLWRLKPDVLTNIVENQLREWTKLYNRDQW